ncbi:hypothetical protein ACTXT7_000705 [Hymenolepis weldensis]
MDFDSNRLTNILDANGVLSIYSPFLIAMSRSTASTNMNEHSSRSHAIFTIIVECSELLGDGTVENRIVRQGKLHLVDLATQNSTNDWLISESCTHRAMIYEELEHWILLKNPTVKFQQSRLRLEVTVKKSSDTKENCNEILTQSWPKKIEFFSFSSPKLPKVSNLVSDNSVPHHAGRAKIVKNEAEKRFSKVARKGNQKTQAEGQRLRESSKINLSLSTLGNVIFALANGKSTHVPYRNSKLTRLLQDSLGGNSKTVMLISVPRIITTRNLSILCYASRAKLIKNMTKINEDPKDALIRQFQKEIVELRAQLSDVPS